MADDKKVLASRAAEQAKHAAQNSGRAVEAAAEEITKPVLRPGTYLELTHLGKGFIALSLASAGATFAFVQFKKAWDGKIE